MIGPILTIPLMQDPNLAGQQALEQEEGRAVQHALPASALHFIYYMVYQPKTSGGCCCCSSGPLH